MRIGVLSFAALGLLLACANDGDERYFGSEPTIFPPEYVGEEIIGPAGTGSTYRPAENLAFGENGTIYRRIGNTTIGSDGTFYVRSGNTIIGSDGTTYRRIGNTTIGSDGTVCHGFRGTGAC